MDMFTLHVEHAVLLGLFTVLTLINCRLHTGAKGIYWFPAYTFCAFTGALFIAVRGNGASEAWFVLFGTSFFHLAYLCLHRGLDGFFPVKNRSRWPMLAQAAAVAVAVASLLEFAVIHPDTPHRVIAFSFIFTFQTGLTAVILLRNAGGHLAFPSRLMSGLLLLIALNNLVRAVVTLVGGAPANYMQGGLPLQIGLLGTTVLQAGVTVAFVWMTASVLLYKLNTLASTDSLTGLLNRRALELAVDREIALSRRNGMALAAVMIDLDHFKQINDSFGHAFGDRVLVEVGRCLQDHMRQSDLLARVGGDEFAVILNNAGASEAMEIAERLRAALERLTVVDGEAVAHVSASFGLAQADAATDGWNDLAMRCDKAVYAGKGVGGNLAVAR